MNIRIFTLVCLFASAVFAGAAMALDGMGAGSLDQKISAKGCDTRLDTAQITNFAIGTLGDWTLSLPDADYHGTYTSKKGTTFSLDPDDASRDALAGELAEAANELCGEVPGTLAITSMQLKKFTVKLAKDRSTLTLKLKVNAIATNGVRTVKPKLSAEGTVVFTPTGGGIGGKISGQVLAPDGQIAAAEPPGLLVALSDFILPPSRAAVSGLLPVPNGTPVELVHLSVAGTVDGVLATAKVKKKGKYSFNLDRLGHYDAPDLAVRVSDRGVQMRAFLNAHTVDITPVSEAVFQLVLEAMLATPGALLENFTFAELDDLSASVDLLTSLKGLVAMPGIDATVAAIKDLVAEDPGIVTFLTAATGAGQTDIGPGDVGNLFPLTPGNTWAYLVDDGYEYAEWTSVTGVREINGITASVVNYTDSLGASFDEYLEENSHGLYNWGNTDMEDFYTDEIIPYQQESFPIKLGSSLEIANHTNLVWADDLDGDGQYERFNITAVITTLGYEAVAVPAGSFPVTLKQQVDIKVDITLSMSGKHAKATEIMTQWLASGIGPVKISDKTTVSAFGKTRTYTSTSVLDGYRVDGETGGNVPSIGVFENLFGGGGRGTPAVGTDGSNYLAVSCRVAVDDEPNGIIGRLITVDGQLSDEIAIASQSCNYLLHIDVGFDGNNYLVIYRNYKDTGTGIWGVRISTDGQVLDQGGGFNIYTGSIYGERMSVRLAFDGSNYMVVWPQDIEHQYYITEHILGAMISPEGEVSASFVIATGDGFRQPDIAFDGSNYFVVWQIVQPGGYWEDDIYGARVTTDGEVLDPDGIPIVALPGYQNSPQIAFDGNTYLAIWLDTLPTDSSVEAIYGKRINMDGVLLDGDASTQGIAINIYAKSKESPTLVYDGTSYSAAWSYDFTSLTQPWGIYSASVSTDDMVVDPAPDTFGNAVSDMYLWMNDYVQPASASNGDNVFIVWLNKKYVLSVEGQFINK